MIKHGIQPNRYDRRDHSHERTFGTIDPLSLPKEYNADRTGEFPDQNRDGYPNGCSGYTQNDTGENEYNKRFDPAFVYQNTLTIANLPPHSPVQVRDSFRAVRLYGLKPMDSRDGDPSLYKRGKYFDVDKVGDYFDGARVALWLNRQANRALSVGTPWYWSFIKPDGFMRDWGKKKAGDVWHNYEVTGWKTVDNKECLIVKAWCGPSWGDKGYGYMSREVFNRLMGISGTFLYIQRNWDQTDIPSIRFDLIEFVMDLLRRFKKPATPELIDKIVPSGKSKQERFYEYAKSKLGIDVSPRDIAPDRLACAESLNEVVRGFFGNPIGENLVSTKILFDKLCEDERFYQVANSQVLPGDISIAVTGESTNGSPHGHCGVWGKETVMSNDSDTGKWSAHYTKDAWVKVFAGTLGFPLHTFRLRD